MKDLPAYKQTALGPLPIEWQALKMKDVCKVNQGLQIPISERYLEQIPNSEFYITNEFLKVGSKNRFYILDAPESVKCVEDDILMTRTGNTGMVVTNVKGAFHNNFFKIKYDKSLLHKYFLVYFLRYPKTQHKILVLAGNSTIPDLNHSDFYSLGIQLPPLPEQQKIAEILSAWDKAIETCQKTIEELQQRNRGLRIKLFSENENWKKEELGNVLKYTQPQNFLTDNFVQKQIENYSMPVLTANKSFILGYTDERQGLYENLPVIIFDDFTTSSHYVDFAFKIKSSAIKLLTVKGNNDLKFCYHLLQLIKTQIGEHKRRWISEFEDKVVKIPELSEQKRIVSILDTAASELKHYEEKLQNLKLQKKGLMQQLLTGKVRTL